MSNIFTKDMNGDAIIAHASVCWSCSVCDCEWLAKGAPVPGWETEPTTIAMYANKGGLRVVACPKMKPFEKRKSSDLIAPELPRRPYAKRKSASY